MNVTSEGSSNRTDKIAQLGEFRVNDIHIYIAEDEKFSFKKLIKFIGPGFLVSVGYIDPGNWATDVEGGSRFGYQLLWVLLLSNLIALLLQILSSRLGIVTELDLAQLCRKQYPKPVCIVLWVLCEIAIAATDLAEVLGTAIGLQLLFKLPLLIGCVLTAADTLIFLLVQRYGLRKLEFIIFFLLSIITSCFIIELFLSKPVFVDVMKGFIPTISSESLYIALGMVGATVMPHNFYLHSSVVQSRKCGRSNNQIELACKYNLWDAAIALNIALFVNMSILIVAAAVFYKNGIVVTELQDAHNLLEGLLASNIAPIVFGLGLFCAGQSSTLTGTMAGQIVMEGFLEMRMLPWLRRLLTRVIAIVPAVIVILIVGDSGTYQLLILSQVVLSVQLPFAILPIIRFTSDKKLMKSFVNPLWVTILGSISVLFITGLNIWMVGGYVIQLFQLKNNYGIIIGVIIVIPLILFLSLLLIYLSIFGLFIPRSQFIRKLWYFGDAHLLSEDIIEDDSISSSPLLNGREGFNGNYGNDKYSNGRVN